MKTLITMLLMLALLPTAAQAQYGRTRDKLLPVINPPTRHQNGQWRSINPKQGPLNPAPGALNPAPSLRNPARALRNPKPVDVRPRQPRRRY